MANGATASRTARLALAAMCATAAIGVTVADAVAQGWWPWSTPDERRPPVPREPVRPGGPPPIQPGGAPPGGPPPGQQAAPYGPRGPSNLCLQLEQRLVMEIQGGAGQARESLPKIEADMRELERTVRTTTIQLDRSDCFDQFLFSKTLRRTPRCVQLNNDLENARQRIADLDRQRRQIMGTGDRSLQDDIIRELARNGCGAQYSQEARKRDQSSNPFAMLFGGEESDGPKGPTNQFSSLPFATYRTLCVRLCDGYYFPISFSTLPNHFQRDSQVCQSQCAAPVELFYHQNPGGAVEQAVSVETQQPYSGLKVAFRYRKEYVQGCSCKQAEYNPALVGTKKAEAPEPQPTTPNVRVGKRQQ
jgi:hypothetical protein